MIVVHVDRSVTVLSDVFCWQPLKHWHPCWSCLPSYQPDDLPLFRCMQCKNCPPMPSWVSCLRNAGGWFMNQEICKGVWDFGFSSYSFRVSFNYLCPNLTGRPQIWPYPRWWFGIVRNAPDTNTAWHIFATVDSWRIYFHLMNWPVLPFEHWWPTDQASKSGWLHSRVFLVSISIWVTLLQDRVFLYTYKCSQMKCACHFYYHFLPVFCPKRRDEPRKKQEQHALVDVFRMMNATIYFRGSVIQYVWVPPRKSDIDTKHGHIQKESNHLFQSIMFEYPC